MIYDFNEWKSISFLLTWNVVEKLNQFFLVFFGDCKLKKIETLCTLGLTQVHSLRFCKIYEKLFTNYVSIVQEKCCFKKFSRPMRGNLCE